MASQSIATWRSKLTMALGAGGQLALFLSMPNIMELKQEAIWIFSRITILARDQKSKGRSSHKDITSARRAPNVSRYCEELSRMILPTSSDPKSSKSSRMKSSRQAHLQRTTTSQSNGLTKKSISLLIQTLIQVPRLSSPPQTNASSSRFTISN